MKKRTIVLSSIIVVILGAVVLAYAITKARASESTTLQTASTFESTPGEGTSIHLLLPIHPQKVK